MSHTHTDESNMSERPKPVKRGNQSKSKDADGDVVMSEISQALEKVKISYKEKAMEMPSPPPEMSKDATAMELAFFLPIPPSDRKRVLVTGPTDILTVNDLTEAKKTYFLRNFVNEQFPKMEKITVQFRLCGKANLGARQHALFILRQLIKLGTTCTFVVKVENLREELSEDEKETDAKKARKKLIEILHGLAGPLFVVLKIEDDLERSSMFDGPPPSLPTET